jgi:hypothetical protein
MGFRVLPLFLVAVALAVFMGAPILADDAGNTTHEGKVVSVSGTKLTMTDKSGKNQHTHVIADTTTITCDGKVCKLEDLKKGMYVKVTTKKGDKTAVLRVDAKKNPIK